MILDIIITKKSRFYLKYLLIFILIVLIIFVLLNNYKKIYKKKEGFEDTSRTETDSNGINFTTGRFIVSSEDLKNEIIRLQKESDRIDGDNKDNLNKYIDDLKKIENKFNDTTNSIGKTNDGYLTKIKNIQNNITKKLREYLNDDKFKIIDESEDVENRKEYIGIVSKDVLNSSCKTNQGGNIFNKCKSVCQQTCIDNDMCYGYNYKDDANGNDYCELVINKREKNDDEKTNLSDTKFLMKKNSQPLNWNYTVYNMKSANPNVESIETIKKPDSIIDCSNKCDAYNDVNNKYCLSFTYGIIPNDDNSSSEKFIKGCKLYGNVFKRDNITTNNIIDNNKNNLYVRNYHDLADTSKKLSVMVNYEPKTPKKIIKEGNIRLKFKDSNIPFKYSTNVKERDLKKNNQALFGSDKNQDIINLEILSNTKHNNLNNVYKNVNPLNNIKNSDNSNLDFNKLLHKNSIIRLKTNGKIIANSWPKDRHCGWKFGKKIKYF